MSGPISRADAMQIAREQAPMLAAAVPPVLVLGLAVLGLATAEQAIVIALVVAIAQLFLVRPSPGRYSRDRGHLPAT